MDTKYLQDVNRGPKVEVLPDQRLRVTRRFDLVDQQAVIRDSDLFLANIEIPWGTVDPDYPQCRLIHQDTPGQVENPNKSPNDPPAYLIRVFEEIDANARTQVGRTDISYDQYGRKTVVNSYLQFSDGTNSYADVVGASTAPAPNAACVLQKFEAPNDGTLIRWKLTYIDSGEMSSVVETHNEGALLIQTLTYLNEVPPAPSGYTLVKQSIEYVEGLPLRTSVFAKGTGIVLNETETKEGGKLIIYRRTEFNPGGAYSPATPAATIGGTVTLVSREIKNEDGFYSYTSMWAEGIGEIDRTIEYFYSDDQGTTGITRTSIKYLSALSVGSNPITPPSGELISLDQVQQDGYQSWSAVYAAGTGTISTEIEYREKGLLVIYKLTAINAAPAAPSATIGGTVVLIDTDVQNGTRIEDGTKIYRYTWAEGNGTISNVTRGEPDGAIVQLITTLTANASTPTSPGAAWYLIDIDQQAQSGYYVNRATYKKPPGAITFKKKINFTKPGFASIGGSPIQFTLSSQVTMTLLADVLVDYATSQITDTPFTVSEWATYYETYTPTDTGIAVSSSKSLGGYLGGASGTSGTNSVFNGILCNSWSYQLGSSTPSSFGTGLKVLDVDNDPYLTATDGTVVYRRTKVSYTF